jgi:hypothetical protein
MLLGVVALQFWRGGLPRINGLPRLLSYRPRQRVWLAGTGWRHSDLRMRAPSSLDPGPVWRKSVVRIGLKRNQRGSVD